MTPPRRAAALTGFALGLTLAACRTPAPPELLRPVLGEQGRVVAWMDRAQREGGLRNGVRAIGKLRLDAERGSGRVKQVIIAERPARLRLESLNFLGQTGTVLVTDGQVFAYYDGKELERGPVSPDLLRDTVGIDLDPAEAVALLLAAPALPRGAPLAVFGIGDDRVLEFASERVRFGSDGELHAVEALGPAGEVRWRARYDRWREVPGGRYPFDMRLHFPLSQLRAEFELEAVEVNPTLDVALFDLLPDRRE